MNLLINFLMNGFVQNYDIKDEYSSSSTLAYRGIKKQTKIPKMLLGLSSVLLFNSIDNINVGNMECDFSVSSPIDNNICISGSICFAEIAPEYFSFEFKRKISAKIKHAYHIPDEELQKNINESNQANLNFERLSNDIRSFINYKSALLISGLDRWL